MHIGFSWSHIEVISGILFVIGSLTFLASLLVMCFKKQKKSRNQGLLIGLLIGFLFGAATLFLASNGGYVVYDTQLRDLEQTSQDSYNEGLRAGREFCSKFRE